ncbi:hypothetical protein ACQKWADRAFT_83658 [Trichoderma austrokoningii]
MATTIPLIKIDPNGDTLFILRKPNKPFARDASFEPWPMSLPRYWTLAQQGNEEALKNSALATSSDSEYAPDDAPEIRMRLSSKHLTLNSTYFQKLADNDWADTNKDNGYSYTVTAEEWDQKALIILMNVLHGKTHKVPRRIYLEKLAKIAVLVDYYGCHKAVDFFAKAWIGRLKAPFPTSYSRQLLLRLFVSYVFSDDKAFTRLTRTIIYEGRGPIHALGLPIPADMVDALESSRQELLQGYKLTIKEVEAALMDGQGCSFECS